MTVLDSIAMRARRALEQVVLVLVVAERPLDGLVGHVEELVARRLRRERRRNDHILTVAMIVVRRPCERKVAGGRINDDVAVKEKFALPQTREGRRERRYDGAAA